MALLLLSPLVLPLAAHAAVQDHVARDMDMDMDMDMSGDMPCPPRGEEVSSCCMQSGLLSSLRTVPQWLPAPLLPLASGLLDASGYSAALRAPDRTHAYRPPDRRVRGPAPQTPLHVLHASFLL